MKKLFPIVLILAMISALTIAFASCTPEEEKPSSGFELTKDVLSSYTVIIPDGCSDTVQQLASSFCDDLQAATGVEPDFRDDTVIEGNDYFKEAEYEILIGRVKRSEAEEFYKTVRYKDLGYALVGKKVLIVGFNDKSIKNALTRFTNDVVKSTETVLLRSNEKSILEGSYDFDELLLNGVEINKYKIVYPRKSVINEKNYANSLRDWIADKSGYIIDVGADNSSASEYEIHIGNTERVSSDLVAEKNSAGDGTYGVYGKNKFVWLSGTSDKVLRCAVAEFCSLLTVSGRTATLNIESLKTAKPDELSLSVLSYNIYYDLNETARNSDDVLESIASRDPDVFNTVETTDDWFKLFDKKFSGTYTCVKGKKLSSESDGLYNAIFFKTDKFTLLSWGTKWMSDTPDKMSKFDISPHNKGFTYAVLKEKATGAEFVYVAVHTSAGETKTVSPDREKYNGKDGDGSIARKCREQQIEVLKELLDPFSLYPIIIGGDFNAKPTSNAISVLTSGTRYVDATLVADTTIYTLPDNATHPTLCRTSGTDPYTVLNDSANQIDYLFVTKDSITVQKFEEWDNKINGKYPSDHIPVCAEITIYSN